MRKRAPVGYGFKLAALSTTPITVTLSKSLRSVLSLIVQPPPTPSPPQLPLPPQPEHTKHVQLVSRRTTTKSVLAPLRLVFRFLLFFSFSPTSRPPTARRRSTCNCPTPDDHKVCLRPSLSGFPVAPVFHFSSLTTSQLPATLSRDLAPSSVLIAMICTRAQTAARNGLSSSTSNHRGTLFFAALKDLFH